MGERWLFPQREQPPRSIQDSANLATTTPFVPPETAFYV